MDDVVKVVVLLGRGPLRALVGLLSETDTKEGHSKEVEYCLFRTGHASLLQP